MIYSCCNQNRKAAVLGNPTLNGIDYLEVLDSEAVPLGLPRQQTLVIHCLNPCNNAAHADQHHDHRRRKHHRRHRGLGCDRLIAGGSNTPPPLQRSPLRPRRYFTGLPDANQCNRRRHQ